MKIVVVRGCASTYFFSLFHRTANLHRECDLIHLRPADDSRAPLLLKQTHNTPQPATQWRGSYLLSPSPRVATAPAVAAAIQGSGV